MDLPAAEPDPPAPKPAQAAPAAGALIEGVIVDPEGRTVPEVSILAHFARRGSDCFDRSCGVAAAQTDTAGRFTLTVPRGTQWATVDFNAPRFVPPERRMVRAYGATLLRAPYDDIGQPSQVPADARILGLRSAPGWPRLRVTLERGKSVAGVVERAVGVAAAGVEVQCLWADGDGGMRIARSRTDERGCFSIPVPVPAFVQATSYDHGHRIEARLGPVPPGTSGLRLLLSETVSVNVHVHTPERPFSGGLDVRLKPLALPGFETSASYEYVDAEKERFDIGWQLPGEYEIEAAPRYAPYLPACGRTTIPGPPVDLHLPRAVRVEGLLEGEGLKGFEITWTGPCNPSFLPGNLDDAAGQRGHTFRIGGDRGPFLLEAVGEGGGYVYARREGDRRCAFVTGYRPSDGFLCLTLSDGASVRGRVEAPAGIKLDSLRVRAARGLAAQCAAVREDGTFAIVGLPLGRFRVELISECPFPVRTWIHDAREGVDAGAEDLVLRVRLPATDPGDGS